MAAPAEKNRKLTYRDYLQWDDHERWEIIAGEAYNMTPAPSRAHQEILGALFNAFYNYLVDKSCKVYVAPFDVRLTENQSDSDVSNVVQPDLTVVCDPSKLDEKGCAGSPDLIVEIISPSTAAHDYIRKLALYERRQVPEYWIVHPVDKTVMIFLLTEKQEYGKPRIYAGEDRIPVTLFPDLVIDLKKVFVE
ncbi:MAG: Uma2 family endonuclease [Desulfobacterota bacterium]|jgi:Uma2 family endonuclease|nr:Uma2 family endonuclease [Thermodesulfobacteriota bacterium]